ncbi:MAG: iron-containing alcohol dehydrogenase [bacterium]|nr:iron-containing alcohol dehydrogenase [bacterium]MDY5457922.1 iron-containing alcohol dehydrogenase [Bariatricus sp.]
MKNFTFTVPQDIIFGMGSLKRLPELLKKNGSAKMLLVSDRGLEKLGVVEKVRSIVTASGIEVAEFLDVEPNPSVDTVNAAVKAYQEAEATSIVALGGGSPMDVAKAVGVLAKFGGQITEYEGAHKVPGKIVPIIAIPTTAGTGSEVTAFSVITDTSRNYKLTVFSYELIPSYALLDPELIMTAPASIAASCGVDALIHAWEAYTSRDASPFSDAMAEKAMELIGANIRRFVANRQDEEAACAMMSGSMFAGIAFAWARLGNVHAMSHPVSAFFHVPHGVANSILLPTIVEYNALADHGRYEKIYNYISKESEPVVDFVPEMLVDEARELLKDLGIPSRLSDVGVTEDKIPQMAADAMKSGNILANPRQSAQKDIEMLYHKAL